MEKVLIEVFPVLVLLIFVGCDDGPECGQSENPKCGRNVDYVQGFELTAQNPRERFSPETKACGYGGFHYFVKYSYSDDDAQAQLKNRPNITVKVATSEYGVMKDLAQHKPEYDYNEVYVHWVIAGGVSLPEPKEGEEAKPVTIIVSVSMQKPLIMLGDKSPTISLPIIGTIIGPPPRTIVGQVRINYDTPIGVGDPGDWDPNK